MKSELRREEALQVLKAYWGYDGFRPSQWEIISAALEGKDVLGILPTGGGKSVCFQVPALMTDGLTLVVTPLIALMKDQVQNLSERGVRAIAVHAGMSRPIVSRNGDTTSGPTTCASASCASVSTPRSSP